MANESNGAVFEKLFETITNTNKQLVENFVNTLTPKQPEAKEHIYETVLSSLMQNTGLLMEKQGEFYKNQMDLWMGMMARHRGDDRRAEARPGSVDRRFNAPEWEQYPFFDYIKQYYLMTSKWLTGLVDEASLNDEAKERLAFFTRQYIDALSPTNFAMTNPEVLKLAIETNGANFIEGMKNMAEDFEKGHITMTDESQFEVGRNLAITPGEVVFQNEVLQIIQYTPTCDKVYEKPLLVIPPCVNKYYLMDLQPDNSFVRYMVERGYNTFLISWKSATPEMGHLTWEDYVEQGVIEAISVVREISGQDKINALAFCIGGVLLSSALPVLVARGQNWLESMTLMTAMTDHSEPG